MRFRTSLLLSAFLVFALAASAQTAPTAPKTIYAGGLSYNAGGSVAGTGLFAHAINDSGSYAFTAVDAVPSTLKPFTVTTNFGIGVAQKVATIAGADIFVPTAAGISFSGQNTGWQWNAGALASFHLKGNYYVMPSVRFLKSSVSNGAGYQPIFGVMFGFGK